MQLTLSLFFFGCSGMGSDDFMLPFPLNDREKSSNEWLPRSPFHAFEKLSVPIAQWSLGGVYQCANTALLELTGLGKHDVTMLSLEGLIHPDDFKQLRGALAAFSGVRNEREQLKRELRVCKAGGGWCKGMLDRLICCVFLVL